MAHQNFASLWPVPGPVPGVIVGTAWAADQRARRAAISRILPVDIDHQVRTLGFGTCEMVPKRTSRSAADVPEILTSICNKWGLLVLYELSRGTRRHSELLRAMRGVSQKMLTETLRKLERDRLVNRKVHAVIPPRVDYALTPLGETLMVPLTALYRWMEQHLEQLQDARRAAPPGPAAAQTAGPERP